MKTLVIQTLKVGILVAVALLAWRQRPFTPDKLFPVLGVAWGIFFIFSPAVAPQYLVWIAPFVLFCDRRWFVWLMIGSTLWAFFFYQRISGTFPWYSGQADTSAVPLWGPWMIWAWAACCYGLIVIKKIWTTELHDNGYGN